MYSARLSQSQKLDPELGLVTDVGGNAGEGGEVALLLKGVLCVL
jgi:hypothetical protein